MTLTTVVAVIFAVGLFMVLPYFISNFLKGYIRNDSLLAIIEGVIRILIFVLYVLLISLMKDIRRVYMYHGAEHKCINCIERGWELTVENVMESSRQHRRCGTSFLLFVMLISVVLFFFIRVDNMALKVLIRILLIPVIAGIAYEIIRLAGRSDNWLVRMVSAPGLWLQGLTTKEPDEDMVEVAIKAVEAVFDWRAYLRENFGYYDEEEAADGEENREAADGEAYGAETAADEEAYGAETAADGEAYGAETAADEEAYGAETAADGEAYGAETAADGEAYGAETAADEEAYGAETAAEEEAYGAKAAADVMLEAESAAAGEGQGGAEAAAEGMQSAEDKKTAPQKQWTEENLIVEDEDEPSFIGSDEID